MKVFYVETSGGCGLREGRNVESVEREERRELGRNGEPYRIRPATAADIDWVRNMGGYVPEGAKGV